VRIAAGRDDAGCSTASTSSSRARRAADGAAAGCGGPARRARRAELELAFQASRAPWVAITGTNGKSTTTALAGELFATTAGPRACAATSARPACERAASIPADGVIVAEVSSFQLERVVAFKPALALVTNLTPDHLDRHGDLATYAALKARVFAQQDAGDRAILNADDPATADWAERFALVAKVGYVRMSDRPVLGAFDGAVLDGAGGVVRVREGTGTCSSRRARSAFPVRTT
jgi:UDP-N-acetylmuramyl tripeptide synthase